MKRSRKEKCPDATQALQYIADAVSELTERQWERIDFGTPFDQAIRTVTASITLDDIITRVIDRMAEENAVFTREYRHKDSPLHSIVWRVLAGATVWMNAEIAARQRDSAPREVQA